MRKEKKLDVPQLSVGRGVFAMSSATPNDCLGHEYVYQIETKPGPSLKCDIIHIFQSGESPLVKYYHLKVKKRKMSRYKWIKMLDM